MEYLKILSALLFSFSNIFLDSEKNNSFSLIENISNVQQVVWVNKENVLLVKDSDVFLLKTTTNELRSISKRNSNEFVGLGRKDLLFCGIEHYMINSKEEFSTVFKIYNEERELVKEMKFFETIRPLFMNEDVIVAVTALDFLEEHFYEIQMGSGEYKEIVLKKKVFNIKIPRGFDTKRVFVKDEDTYIVEDMFGNLYLKEKIKYIYRRNVRGV